jgi:putative phosphoribosyl transferase
VMELTWSYKDRTHAGEVLVKELRKRDNMKPSLVLAIPNGGVEVAVQIAQEYNTSLDLLIVRKLQIPYNTEAGFGALTSLGTLLLNEPLVKRLGFDQDVIDEVRRRTEAQIEDRKEAYAGLVGHTNPTAKDVLLVDDGLASGYTMLAAVQSVKEKKPSSIAVAVPTSSRSAFEKVKDIVDSIICPRVESGFVFAVANAYQKWYDVPDSEVIEILRRYIK